MDETIGPRFQNRSIQLLVANSGRKFAPLSASRDIPMSKRKLHLNVNLR
jgi:hypothetical protein